MAASDAKPVPQKNVAYRITFPILDADGDLVTGATGLDSEVSKDGGTFTDCTNEATEIATSSGVYYLDLTSTEMNADTVAVIIKTSSSGAKTTTVVLYPEEAGDIRVNVTAYGGTAGTFSGGRPEVNTSHWGGTAVGSTTVRANLINIAGAAVSTSTAQLGVNVVNFGGSAGTFASGRPAVNASYIGGVPVTATTSITFPAASTVATTTGAVGSVTGAVGSVTGNVGGNVTGSVGSIATGGITSGSFAAGAINNAAMSIDGSELTAIPWNAAWDAEVQSEVEDALVVHRLDELLNADSDIDGAAPPTVGSVFHELMTKTAGSFTYDQTTDSLEALRDRGDAAWITATGFSTHSAADVWAVATRVLTAGTNIVLPSNGLSNVIAWTVDITGSLSGSVGSVTGAVGSVTGAVGSVTGNVGGNVTGSVGSIATGGIAAASFAAGAIDAAAIANGAIDAATFAADVDAEILSYIVDDATRIDASALNTASVTTIPAILADTGTDGVALSSAALTAIWDGGSIDGFTYAGALSSIYFDATAVHDGLVLASGTIGSTGNSTTALHLTGLTYGDDEINDCLIVITDDSTGERHARWITDWADTGDLATVATLPFTPENAVDTYVVLSVRRDVTGTGGLDAAGVRAAIGMASADLDTQLDAIKADTAAILTDTGTTLQGELDAIEADVDTLLTRLGTPSDLGGGATVAANLSDIESQTDDIGAAGAGLTALATAANLATVAGYLDTEIAAILADTNELQTDWANGGRLDLILDARASQTSVDDIPTNAELATALGTADDATLAAIAALNNLSAAQVNAEVDTALADYDGPTNAEMVARTLATADYATATALQTVDTVVDAILVDTAEIGAAGAGLTALGDTRLANLDAAISTRSTLTQAQVTGGAYSLNSASFAFNAALDFTTTQKAATLARVTLVDTTTTNTDMRGTDNAALAATALSTATWTGTLATNLGTTNWTVATNLDAAVSSRSTYAGGAVASVTGNVGGNVAGSVGSVLGGINTTSGTITTLDALDTSQDTQHSTTQTAIADVPTNAELTTALGTADDAVLAAIATLQTYVDTEVAAIKAKTDNLPAAPAATGDIPTVSQIWTTALVEAYRSVGAAGTPAQLLHEIIAHLGDSSISGTTKTINNRAGSAAKTYTLNSASAPTAIAEAS